MVDKWSGIPILEKMNKLITTGNIAIFQYPEGAQNETFEIVKGALFIFGYSASPFGFGRSISAMKRFEGFDGYTVIGKYDYAKTVVEGERDLGEIIYDNEIDFDRCVVLVKSETIDPS